SPVKDVLADDAVVAAARGLIQQGTVGPCIACRWQVADPTRLSQDLAAKPLLVVEAIARLLGERILRASGQQKQEHRGATLHLRFPPNSGFWRTLSLETSEVKSFPRRPKSPEPGCPRQRVSDENLRMD